MPPTKSAMGTALSSRRFANVFCLQCVLVFVEAFGVVSLQQARQPPLSEIRQLLSFARQSLSCLATTLLKAARRRPELRFEATRKVRMRREANGVGDVADGPPCLQVHERRSQAVGTQVLRRATAAEFTDFALKLTLTDSQRRRHLSQSKRPIPVVPSEHVLQALEELLVVS